MTKTITVTELRGNIYKLLEEVLDTGIPLEIAKGGRKLRISPINPDGKIENLVYQPEIIQGDPGDLPDIHWEADIDLP